MRRINKLTFSLRNCARSANLLLSIHVFIFEANIWVARFAFTVRPLLLRSFFSIEKNCRDRPLRHPETRFPPSTRGVDYPPSTGFAVFLQPRGPHQRPLVCRILTLRQLYLSTCRDTLSFCPVFLCSFLSSFPSVQIICCCLQIKGGLWWKSTWNLRF